MREESEPPEPGRRELFAVSLYCRACGRTEEQTVAGLFDYLPASWPECCGEPMAGSLKWARREDPPKGTG